MKKLKWVLVALSILMLTACVPHGVWLSSEEKTKPVEEVPAMETPQPEVSCPSEFSVYYGEKQLQIGTLWFGGKAYVHKEQAEAIFERTFDASATVSHPSGSYIALAQVVEELGCDIWEDIPRNKMYLAPVGESWQIPEGYSVPTLMYHGVSDNMWGGTSLFVKPAEMEKQIVYLLENGYTPIWFEDLVHVDEIEKPVLLTYDDGYVDNYVDLFPILQKYGVKVTIFLITGAVDHNPNFLTSAQIKEMAASGLVSFQSHTVSHPDYLNALSRQDQEYELRQSALDVAALTGKIPTVICYPVGNFSETTLELARQYYQMGINMNGNEYITGEDRYKVDRYFIDRQDPLSTFIQYIQ